MEWEERTDDKYRAAGVHFDLLAMKHLNPVANNEQHDEAYQKREKELKELIEKNNNKKCPSDGGVCRHYSGEGLHLSPQWKVRQGE